MLLKLTRNQKKGMMGGMKFVLTARAELTPEEAQHVRTYGLSDTLLWDRASINPNAAAAGWISQLTKTHTIRIHDLVAGRDIDCKNIGEMLSHEAALKEACQTFKAILDAAAKFGGEEVIVIGEEEAQAAAA
jgi:hypothetical protein